MGFFSKDRSNGRGGSAIVSSTELARLGAVGRAAFGQGGHPDVSGFYLPAFQRASSSGAADIDRFAQQLITELSAGATAAAASDEWAYAGALYVTIDFDGANVANRADAGPIIDGALQLFARHGLGTERIPVFLLARWRDLHG